MLEGLFAAFFEYIPTMHCSEYDMVSFPLTDQMPDRETLGDPPEPSFLSSHQGTTLTDASGTNAEAAENKEPGGEC